MEYIRELYEDHREQMPKFEVTSAAKIMKKEIQKTLKSMKDGKQQVQMSYRQKH